VYLFGSISGCTNSQKMHEKLISGCFGPFLQLE
jgi:hypothetical protein